MAFGRVRDIRLSPLNKLRPERDSVCTSLRNMLYIVGGEASVSGGARV